MPTFFTGKLSKFKVRNPAYLNQVPPIKDLISVYKPNIFSSANTIPAHESNQSIIVTASSDKAVVTRDDELSNNSYVAEIDDSKAIQSSKVINALQITDHSNDFQDQQSIKKTTVDTTSDSIEVQINPLLHVMDTGNEVKFSSKASSSIASTKVIKDQKHQAPNALLEAIRKRANKNTT